MASRAESHHDVMRQLGWSDDRIREKLKRLGYPDYEIQDVMGYAPKMQTRKDDQDRSSQQLEIKRLKAVAQQKTEEHEKTKRELAEAKREVKEAEREVKEAGRKQKQMETENASLKSENDGLKRDSAKMADIDGLLDTHHKRLLDELSAKIAAAPLQERSQMRAECARTRQEITCVTKEFEKKVQDLQVVTEEQGATPQEQGATLQEQGRMLRGNTAQLKEHGEKIPQAPTQLNDIRNRIAHLETETQTRGRDQDQDHAQIQDLCVRINRLEDMRASVAALRSGLNNLRADVGDLDVDGKFRDILAKLEELEELCKPENLTANLD